MSEAERPSGDHSRARDLSPALYRAAVALGRTRDAAEVVRAAIVETQRAAGLEAVALYVLDRDHDALVLTESAGTTPEFQERMSVLPLSEAGLAARAIREHDIATSPVNTHPTPKLRATFAEHGFQYLTVVPVVGQDQTLGILYLASREAVPLAAEESGLVHAVGGLVGVALENAELREQLVSHRERLRALAGGVLRAREEEARRIAHELHDEAGQLLAALHIALDGLVSETPEQAARFRNLHEGLDRVEAQLRRLAHELRPKILDDFGLAAALEWLAQGVGDRTGVAVEIAAPVGRLPAEVETALYRIIQEALSNAVRHGHPRRIAVVVREADGQVRAVVRDDGRGFDVASVLARRGEGGLGLIGMRERAEALGGTIEIQSTPNQGTELCVLVPRERGW